MGESKLPPRFGCVMICLVCIAAFHLLTPGKGSNTLRYDPEQDS